MFDLWMFRQEVLNRGFFNLAFVLAIDLVSDENEGELFRFFGCALIEELSDPGLNVIKGLPKTIVTRLLVISYTKTQQSAPR